MPLKVLLVKACSDTYIENYNGIHEHFIDEIIIITLISMIVKRISCQFQKLSSVTFYHIVVFYLFSYIPNVWPCNNIDKYKSNKQSVILMLFSYIENVFFISHLFLTVLPFILCVGFICSKKIYVVGLNPDFAYYCYNWM